ncbi:MAG: NAD(P)H-dependent oxidoreductase [Cohaesibacter sp.]|nr:NAD(P)H-dependent oxidoreductase [Cohaesibacter sp.]
MKVLLYLAHPNFDRSGINRPMFEAARGIDGVTCVDLYACYPTLEIDRDREQARLLAHDVIVLQHPLHWYSAPSILKEWLDQVLGYGFAYGQDAKGDVVLALAGKYIFHAVSCGSPKEAYRADGANGADVRQLLLPFEKSFEFCHMRSLAPFVLFSAGLPMAIDDGNAGQRERVEILRTYRHHLQDWKQMLIALRDHELDFEQAQSARILNELLPTLFVQTGDL